MQSHQLKMYSSNNNTDKEIEQRMNMYRVPVQSGYRRRRRQRDKKASFRLALLILIGVICIIAFFKLPLEWNFDFGKVAESAHSPFDINFNFSPRRQNILVMGVDVASNTSNPFKGNRSDTMLLVSIAPYGKNVNIISIPRDSKVYLAGKNKTDKINHAFAFGGAKMSVKTVEETFGVRINNYLAISNEGIVKLIDILGGLPIYIEKNMKYDDYTAKLHINLTQGNHVLTGKEVEGYLRFRHDSYGDIGRIRRQQWFFNALMARLKDPSIVSKLPEILKVMPEYIQTDMSGYDLAKCLGMAKNIDSSTVQVATIPGAPSTKGVISYWIIDPEKTQDLIDKMIYRNKADVNYNELSVGILYSAAKEEQAVRLKQLLLNSGIKEVKLQNSKNVNKSYIAIHNLDITGDTIAELKKVIPEIKDEHTIYDPIGINRTGKDLTIVVAEAK